IATAQGSALHTLRVGELKAMLALAAGELETAMEFIDWTMEFNLSVFPADRANYYRALRACVELLLDESRDPAQYLGVFSRMYGQETLTQAWANANGESRFFGLKAADLSLVQFPQHQKLLAAYEKLQQAKRAHHWA
ncbi:MAG: 30S ribosomal protein S12 methylthiotransferase accessory factor YcaO, partial [Aeromonas sp.]